MASGEADLHCLSLAACSMIRQAFEDVIVYMEASDPTPEMTRNYLTACLWITGGGRCVLPLSLCLDIINQSLEDHGVDFELNPRHFTGLLKKILAGGADRSTPAVQAVLNLNRHVIVTAGKKRRTDETDEWRVTDL